MQPKRDNQPSFFDLAIEQRGASNRVLETITREVNFTEAEQRVAATYGPGGRPACRVGILLRVMILQHLYGLSDPQAEEQLKDRLSFQKLLKLTKVKQNIGSEGQTILIFLCLKVSNTTSTFWKKLKKGMRG